METYKYVSYNKNKQSEDIIIEEPLNSFFVEALQNLIYNLQKKNKKQNFNFSKIIIETDKNRIEKTKKFHKDCLVLFLDIKNDNLISPRKTTNEDSITKIGSPKSPRNGKEENKINKNNEEIEINNNNEELENNEKVSSPIKKKNKTPIKKHNNEESFFEDEKLKKKLEEERIEKEKKEEEDKIKKIEFEKKLEEERIKREEQVKQNSYGEKIKKNSPNNSPITSLSNSTLSNSTLSSSTLSSSILSNSVISSSLNTIDFIKQEPIIKLKVGEKFNFVGELKHNGKAPEADTSQIFLVSDLKVRKNIVIIPEKVEVEGEIKIGEIKKVTFQIETKESGVVILNYKIQNKSDQILGILSQKLKIT